MRCWVKLCKPLVEADHIGVHRSCVLSKVVCFVSEVGVIERGCREKRLSWKRLSWKRLS